MTFGFLGSFYNKMLMKPGFNEDENQGYLMLQEEIIYSKDLFPRISLLSL